MEFDKRVLFACAIALVSLCVLTPSVHASSDWKSSDSAVLLDILATWQPGLLGNGASRQALDGANVCALRLSGVTCSTEERVIGLDLSKKNLQGNIPASLGRLTALEVLDLSSNELYGEIPFALAHLPRLRTLNLQGNPISGRLPSSETSFSALTNLNIRDTLLDICAAPAWATNVQECCVFKSDCTTFAHCASSCSADVVVSRSMKKDAMADEPVTTNVPAPTSKLSKSQVAGIAVGVAIGLVLIGVGIFVAIVETTRKTEPEQQIEMPRRFGHQDSSLTTMDSRRDLSRPNNLSKPPASTDPESSSSSSSMSISEPDEPVAPPKKAKKPKAEEADETAPPAPAVGTSQDTLLQKPKRKKKKAKATAAAADEDED